MNANFTKADMKELREKIKAVGERVHQTIGQSSNMTGMEFACFQQLETALFNAATLVHQFWNVANKD